MFIKFWVHHTQLRCNSEAMVGEASGKPRERTPPKKNFCDIGTSVEVISVVTLIRTDTTLDHSQKAEKVWFSFMKHLGSSVVRTGRTGYTELVIKQKKLGNLPIHIVSPKKGHKNLEVALNAITTRQSLVKGERLVRHEMRAVIPIPNLKYPHPN